jgi:hypothetical protein
MSGNKHQLDEEMPAPNKKSKVERSVSFKDPPSAMMMSTPDDSSGLFVFFSP